MEIDARTLPAEDTLDTDVCIVGAGPAGITLALELANQRFRVCLVESGGREADPQTQSLAGGEVSGDPYPNLEETRQRRFGGTSHLWEAQTGYRTPGWRCLPLDPIDFEKRAWVPYSGWCFDRQHLDPFYARAHKLCKIGPYSYEVEDWESEEACQLPLRTDHLITCMSQYGSRTPFTQEYRQDLQNAANITTLLYANVTNLETDETAQTVTRLRITRLDRTGIWLQAKLVILATGGIENPRLLLMSNQQQPNGLGNQHDLVGRFFMERPIVTCGMLTPYHRQLFDQTGLYDVREFQGTPAMAWIKLTDDGIRREQLLNNGVQLFPRPLTHQTVATRSLRKLVSHLRHGKLSRELGQHLLAALKGADYVTAAGFWAAIRQLPGLKRGDWSFLPLEKRRFSRFEVIYQIEQAPNPNNRVTLSSNRDLLGSPQAQLHWQLHDIDIRTVKRVQKILKEEFAHSRIGELDIARDGDKLKFDKLTIHHHMGTTRMHDDPKQGVVDANLKIHGMTNLFITGSSVFPTAGYANPTLTIIALAIRLADHIKHLYQASSLHLPSQEQSVSLNAGVAE